MILTEQNYKTGFLIDDEVIGGVTEMANGVYATYVSHYLTGETFVYEEFNELQPALFHLAGLQRTWKFEAVGCSKTSKSGSGCGSSSTNGGASGCSRGGCGCT